MFSDVDGTILDGSHRVTELTARVARALVERGIDLVLVSARMPEALSAIERDLGCGGPVVCYSGAYVLDGAGNELLSRVISPGCALEVRDFVACAVPEVCCMAYGFHTWIVPDRDDLRVRREEKIVGVTATEGSIEQFFSESGLHKLLLVGEPVSVQRAERMVGTAFPGLSVVRSSPILCEIMDGRTSKTEGIRTICDHVGADLADAMAFGDGYNDIDMLRAVPESYAMANAPALVKAAAARVTACDNEHDGFAKTVLSAVFGR